LDEKSMRLALHSVIREGAEAAYAKTHGRVPRDLLDSFDRFGITSWTIWRSGRDLFHLVEADDFGAALDLLAEDPANQRWQAVIGPFVETFTGGQDGEPAALSEVWDLKEQKKDEGDAR
jgi:L-rhamnose mutarotase